MFKTVNTKLLIVRGDMCAMHNRRNCPSSCPVKTQFIARASGRPRKPEVDSGRGSRYGQVAMDS